MKRLALVLALALVVMACTDMRKGPRGVYMLIDTSGTYAEEIAKAQNIINYLLGTLEPGDSLSVARIDSGSFSERDIIAKVTFDQRPSVANRQKVAFKEQFDAFAAAVKGSRHTDITGGLLQAVEFLNETGASRKSVIIFSDLEEDLQAGQVRDIPLMLAGFEVVALNVTKLRKDNVDPRNYLDRLDLWKKRVEDGGGRWRVVNDLERIENVIQG